MLVFPPSTYHTHARMHAHYMRTRTHTLTHSHTQIQHSLESPNAVTEDITMETRGAEVPEDLSPASPPDAQRTFHERAL